MDDLAQAAIGHNNPPEPTPFDLSREEIEGLYIEAKNWLDGGKVETQAQADEIGKLIDQARKAAKAADERRAAEKKPHDDAGKAVQAKYKPLLDRATAIADVAKRALAPYLAEQQRQRDEEARRAREKAEEARREAEAAIRAASASADLGAAEAAETLLRQAKGADRTAREAENTKATAKGGARAVSLRTIYHADVSDMKAFAAYVWTTHRADLDEWFASYAKQLVRGGTRNIPGVTITEERIAQ